MPAPASRVTSRPPAPGPRAWGYLLRDTFRDPDATALTSHAPDVGPGWAATTGTFKILSNALAPNSAADGDKTLIDCGRADHVVWADIAPSYTDDSNISFMGLMVRATDSTHHWLVTIVSGTAYLLENTGSGYTAPASGSYSATGSGVARRVVVACFSTTIVVWVNGTKIIEYTGASSNSTATKVGVYYGKTGTPPGTAGLDTFTSPRCDFSVSAILTNAFFVLRPTGLADSVAAPMVVYHHGAGETAYSLFGDSLKSDTVAALVGAGYRVISSTAAGDNWGNAAGQAAYRTLFDTLTGAGVRTSKVLFLSQSMGGFTGLNCLANRATWPEVTGWYGIYPCCSLSAMFAGNAGTFSAAIRTAYGIASDGSDYASKTSGFDPALLSGRAFAGLRMRFTASSGDTVVNRAANTEAMLQVVGGYAREASFRPHTGDHGDASAFDPQDVIDFFARC